jgi:hypothetical protein
MQKWRSFKFPKTGFLIKNTYMRRGIIYFDMFLFFRPGMEERQREVRAAKHQRALQKGGDS